MIAAWLLGLTLAWQGNHWAEHWFHAKVGLLIGMQIVHAALARWRRAFANDANVHSDGFYRFMNEVPTLLLIGIVILAVVKPFQP
jgi:putative membrane protein